MFAPGNDKAMKIKELRRKTNKELKETLEENRHKLGQLRFDLAAKKLKDVRQVRELRREIARILTILSTGKNE